MCHPYVVVVRSLDRRVEISPRSLTLCGLLLLLLRAQSHLVLLADLHRQIFQLSIVTLFFLLLHFVALLPNFRCVQLIRLREVSPTHIVDKSLPIAEGGPLEPRLRFIANLTAQVLKLPT